MVRDYNSLDLDRLWELYKNSLSCPFWQFKEAVETGKTLVYEGVSPIGEKRIYGFVISLIDDDPWIWSIVVQSFHQGEGIGTKLMAEIESRYPGYARFCLYVKNDNPAQRLYFDLGYRVVDVVTGVYADGPALKMVKDLK